jgi:hypothetical protein
LNGKRRHALTVWLGCEKKNTGKRVRKGDGMEVWGAIGFWFRSYPLRRRAAATSISMGPVLD